MVQSWRGELEGFVRARADDVLGRLAEERLPVAGDGVGKRARRSTTPVALLARAPNAGASAETKKSSSPKPKSARTQRVSPGLHFHQGRSHRLSHSSRQH